MAEKRPELRIGDVERRGVDTRLQQAHADGRLTLTEYDERARQCWAARSQAELDVLTADLPPDPAAPKAVARASAPQRAPQRRSLAGTFGGLAAAAVLVYSGLSIVGADDGAAVFGDKTVTVGPGQDRVEVGMLFGDVEVVVPDGAHATATGTVIFGGSRCLQACLPQAAGAQQITVDARGAFGKVQIRTESEKRFQPVDSDRDDD